MEKHKKRLSLSSIVLLLIVCIGSMQLLFCRIADPELFERIVTPVVRYSQMAWGKTTQLISEGAAELGDFAGRVFATPAVQPEPAEAVQTAELPAEEPVITTMELREGQDILLGGNVEMVFYQQSGEAWRAQPYGTDDIGTYGCGPTAMAMIISSMTVYDVNPVQMAAWAVENGYWAPGDGSYQSIIPGAAKSYGLHCTALQPQDADALRAELASGNIVVALMGAGHFTDGGHFIVLRGVTQEGDILAADPNSEENSLEAWDAQLILDELAQGRENTLWRITA